MKECMRSRVSDDWVPQMEEATGRRFYYSIKTGKCTNTHPNQLIAENIIRKQRDRAEGLFRDGQAERKEYKDKLLQSEAAHRQEQEILIHKLLRSECASLNPTPHIA